MPEAIPSVFTDMLTLADPSWRPALSSGLQAIADKDPTYLSALAADSYLPTEGRLFAAFAQPIDKVRYVLVGEGPYPRPESATGVCFMDGAVQSLWSEKGLSKQVNRATSLRNFMKMLLVADNELSLADTTGDAMARVALKARMIGSPLVQTLAELQENLGKEGFLLLNATLVFRPTVAPLKDAKAWQPFVQTILNALADHAERNAKTPSTLVLWGKAAELLNALPSNARFPKAVSEHPYNLSFIGNATMQELFGPMRLLQRRNDLA